MSKTEENHLKALARRTDKKKKKNQEKSLLLLHVVASTAGVAVLVVRHEDARSALGAEA